MPIEYAIAALVFILVAAGPLVAIVLSVIAFARTRKTAELTRRIEQLEAALAASGRPRPPVTVEPPVLPGAETAGLVEAEVVETRESATVPAEPREAFQWEMFVGQKALGWAAVVLLILAAAFFLRYAYQNNWIGPVGRVAIGCLAGAGLVIAGQRYQQRGWRLFSQMLSAGGMVVLYLATYSAFGFYRLLPQQHAGLFLAVIVVESMVIAALYDSPAIGLVAVLGGLLTPLLLESEQDAYVALFTYLAVLDLGTVVLLVLRAWPAIGTVALLGTHGIFWFWYDGFYHPEKLVWALGFQLVVFAVFLGQTLVSNLLRQRRESWEGMARLGGNAALGFSAFYVLMRDEHQVWMGTAALVMATIYAAVARATLGSTTNNSRLLLTSLSVAVGFIALAFPIQADTNWVALGWAATAAALWWFGQRISAPTLRAIAGVLVACAVSRVLVFDIPRGVREPFIPVFNEFALPAIGVVACVLAAVIATRRFLPRLQFGERFLIGAGGLASLLLLWLILSVDCYGYFEAQARLPGADRDHTRWLGQLSLSVLWAVYASFVLACGFRLRLARLRWLAIMVYAVTVAKVLLVDMANLQQFYRILAFFILAVFLGLAARAYQRLKLTGAEKPIEES